VVEGCSVSRRRRRLQPVKKLGYWDLRLVVGCFCFVGLEVGAKEVKALGCGTCGWWLRGSAAHGGGGGRGEWRQGPSRQRFPRRCLSPFGFEAEVEVAVAANPARASGG
jgi:hypothetical protein